MKRLGTQFAVACCFVGLAMIACDARPAIVDDGGQATPADLLVDAPIADAPIALADGSPPGVDALLSCAQLDVCACYARSDCEPETEGCLCPCVDFTCDDCPATPAPCSCGGGRFLRCVPAKKANGEPCGANDRCRSTRCYSDVGPDGSFTRKTCREGCIALWDYSVACYDDSHCCTGRCCVGCGEREGVCISD